MTDFNENYNVSRDVPAALGPLSGIHALASVGGNVVQQLGKWSINPKSESSDVAHSATKQALDRVPGNWDWDGSYTAYGDTPAVWPGQKMTFIGTIDNGATYGSLGYRGDVIIDEVSLKIDIEGGKEIGHDVKFSGDGQLLPFYSTYQVLLDTCVNPLASATACSASLGTIHATPSYTDGVILDVRSIDISLKAANKAYNSSATLGYTKRVPGNLDASVSLGVYCQSGSGFSELASYAALDGKSLPAPNSVWALKCFTSASRYWEFAWILFGQKTGIDVDRHSGNVIGCTLNGSFKAVAGTTASTSVGLLGWIKDPAGTKRWNP